MDKNIAKKLMAFQNKIEVITKELDNPYFKSKYFDVNKVIEIIKPVLNEVGLVVLQPLTSLNGKTAIRTVLVDCDTGESYSEEPVCLPDTSKAQETGSAITYFRRYCLTSLLLLQGEEDDDGNVASQKIVGKDNNSDPKKQCPNCKKWHQGKYPKCLECFSGNTKPTKTLINGDADPFEN